MSKDKARRTSKHIKLQNEKKAKARTKRFNKPKQGRVKLNKAGKALRSSVSLAVNRYGLPPLRLPMTERESLQLDEVISFVAARLQRKGIILDPNNAKNDELVAAGMIVILSALNNGVSPSEVLNALEC